MRGKYRRRARFYPQTGNTYKRSGLRVIAASFCIVFSCFFMMFLTIDDYFYYFPDAVEYKKFLDVLEPFYKRHGIDYHYGVKWGHGYFIMYSAEYYGINSDYDDAYDYDNFNPDTFVDDFFKMLDLFHEEHPDVRIPHHFFGSREATEEYIRYGSRKRDSTIFVAVCNGFCVSVFLLNNNQNTDNSPYLRAKRRCETHKRLAARYTFDSVKDF